MIEAVNGSRRCRGSERPDGRMQELNPHKMITAIHEEALVIHTNEGRQAILDRKRVPIEQEGTHVLTHALDESQQQIFENREQLRGDSVLMPQANKAAHLRGGLYITIREPGQGHRRWIRQVAMLRAMLGGDA